MDNFFLWQASYSEICPLDILWNDFTEQDFINAINNYKKRERRFGGL